MVNNTNNYQISSNLPPFLFLSNENGEQSSVPTYLALEIFKYLPFTELCEKQTVSKSWAATILYITWPTRAASQCLTHSIPRYLLITPNRIDPAGTRSWRDTANYDDFEKPKEEKININNLLSHEELETLEKHLEEPESDETRFRHLFQFSKMQRLFSVATKDFSLIYANLSSSNSTYQLEMCPKEPCMNIIWQEGFFPLPQLSTIDSQRLQKFKVKAIFEELCPNKSYQAFKHLPVDSLRALLRLYKIECTSSAQSEFFQSHLTRAIAAVNRKNREISEQEDETVLSTCL